MDFWENSNSNVVSVLFTGCSGVLIVARPEFLLHPCIL